MAFATGTGMSRGMPFVFKSLSAETAAVIHGSVEPVNTANLTLTITVTAVSGTTPTMLLVVEGSADGTNWFTVSTFGANGYSLGSLGTTPTNFTAAATTRGVVPMSEFMRTRSVIGGTTPSFTYRVEGAVS